MSITTPFTVEDLEALPDDGHVWELIDGELVRREAGSARQGAVQWTIGGWLWQFLQQNPIGVASGADTTYSFQRDPDRRLRPDLSFIKADRFPPAELFDRPLEVGPDLVVEVVSPNDRAVGIEEKFETYLRAGVPLPWVYWPRRRAVQVYVDGRLDTELSEGDELDGGDVLPGFRVAVVDLFDDGR